MFLQRADHPYPGQQHYPTGTPDTEVAPLEESTPPPSPEEENQLLKAENQELRKALEEAVEHLESNSYSRSITEAFRKQYLLKKEVTLGPTKQPPDILL
ncbi:MAG: hypothetical protein K1000chlam4_00722 [Chlamydiae bacterium]|nr:hypothetical protein [Chlamydiota bacterium]